MEEFDCLQSYVGVPLAGELPLLIIVQHSRGLRVMILLQRVNIRPSMHQTRSPLCFRYGVNEQILFEVGIRSEIKRFVAGMIMTIQLSRVLLIFSSVLHTIVQDTRYKNTKQKYITTRNTKNVQINIRHKFIINN